MDSFSSQPGEKATARPASKLTPDRLSFTLYIPSSLSKRALFRTRRASSAFSAWGTSSLSQRTGPSKNRGRGRGVNPVGMGPPAVSTTPAASKVK